MSADIRRQLEGGVEVLEAAHEGYVVLEKALREKQWQEAVLARLDTLGELVRQQPGSEEALVRLRQRSRVEGWPEAEPALVLAGKVETLRTPLEALLRERLGPAAARKSLAENLAQLHQVLTRTLASPVSPGEMVLHQGVFKASTTMPMLPLLLMLGALVVVVAAGTVLPTAVWSILLLACLLPMSFIPILWEQLEHRRSGQFWLTEKRLVWQPTGQEPIHIPLQALHRDGVRLRSPRSVEVRLVDGRSFSLDSIQGAEQLLTLLKVHVPASGPEEA